MDPMTQVPCSGPALRLLSAALDARQKGARERALEALDRAIDRDGRCADAVRARGLLLMEMGELDPAAADLDRAVRLAPDSACCELERGTVHLLRGRLEVALTAFERALALEPDLAAAHASRAAVLLRQGWLEEALEAISIAVAARPDSDGDLHNRAVVRTALGQHGEAIRDYDQGQARRTVAPAPGTRPFVRGSRVTRRNLVRGLAEAAQHDPLSQDQVIGHRNARD